MGKLGSDKVWVVHGSDGLDEITTTGPTYVSEISGGKLRHFEITPEEAGLPRARMEDLKGDEPTDYDRRVSVALFRVIRAMFTQPALAPFVDGEIEPSAGIETADETTAA